MAITGSVDAGLGRKIVTVDHDPETVATDVPAGSIIINSVGRHFVKLDNGSTTNVVPAALAADSEPMGFEDAKADVTLSWSDSTKTLTLTPTGSFFNVYVKGQAFKKIVPATKDISGVIAEGLWFFYYDGDGVLQASQTAWTFSEHAPVALIHWDATNSKAILVGWELHGLTMDWQTHEYLHRNIGTYYQPNGLTLSGDTAGDGSLDSHAQVAVADGSVWDEDIEVDIHDGAGSGLFEQELSPTGYIPVYYRDGVGGLWRKVTANTFPVKQGTARIQYNLDTAGTWTTPDVTSNLRHMAMWVFATNDKAEPVIAILGQREDVTLANAQDNNTFADLDLGTLPLAEMKILYRLIFQTSSGYANTPSARLREILDLRTAFQQPTGNFVATDHQALSGRAVFPAHPASAVAVNAASFIGDLSDTDTDVQTAFDTLDAPTPTLVQGAKVNYVSATQVSIGTSGETSKLADSTGVMVIEWSGVLTAAITSSGAGGLDTGSEASDTWYAIHSIGDGNGVNSPDVLLSLSATAPTMPSGYDKFRHLGWVRNDGASDFFKFYEAGAGACRRITYDHDTRSELQALSEGAATTLTAVALAEWVPAGAHEAFFCALGDSVSDGAYFVLAHGDSVVAIAEQARRIGLNKDTGGFQIGEALAVPVNAARQIKYGVSVGTVDVNLYVLGFSLEV